MNSTAYWQQVEELFQAALELAEDKRAQFLATACGADESLRSEVASLLAAHAGEAALIDRPAPELAARLLAAKEAESLAGQTIGQYRFLELLGQGGMGEVWLARDEKLQRQVAIKALTVNPLAATQGRTRLFNEAQATARLNHPNVCTVYEILEADARCFIVMQYVEGETLAARLKRERLDWRDAVEIAAQIADALAEAHRLGIIHRDIKPQNVMLDQHRPGRDAVKVLDFGIAELRQGDEETEKQGEVDSPLAPSPRRPVTPPRTTPGLIFGTPGYLAPEQARGEPVDARSDLFSLGVVFFELLTGVAPFEAESASAAIAKSLSTEPPPLADCLPEAPAELAGLVKRALAKQPDERYQTAAELLADLRRLQEKGEAVGSAPSRFVSRRWLAVAAALLVTLAATTLFLWIQRKPAQSAPEQKYPRTPAAYEAYQKGQKAAKYGSAETGIRKEAVEHFTRVIELEPNFAPAYAALALAYYNLHEHDLPGGERLAKAKEAASQALALDQSLADAHLTLANIYFEEEWRFAEAEREYQLAIAYNPNEAQNYHSYAIKLAELGKVSAALEMMQRAMQLEPYSEQQDNVFASVLVFTRQYDQLIKQANRMLERYGPRSGGQLRLAQAYLGKGQYEQALELLRKYYANAASSAPTLAIACALAGRRREALQITKRIQPDGKYDNPYYFAKIYAALGEADTAFAWLEKAYAQHEVLLITLKVELAFDRIRSDPRFAALLGRIGFPD